MLRWSVISTIIGWVYISAWSCSFYPQVILNYRRRSVTGLSLDFLVLNVLGFLCYSIYTVSFLVSSTLQKEYKRRNFTSEGPAVRVNDAVFALHALALSTLMLYQAYLCGYERARNQKVSVLAKMFIIGSVLVTTVSGIFAYYCTLHWLDVIYEISYVKLLVSLGKLLPQLWLNYKRKSTEGWSILNVLLDFTGGVLSLSQLLLDCAVADDWSAVAGNSVKTGLGCFSILFNILFIAQHYVLYKGDRKNSVTATSTALGEEEGLLSTANTAGLRDERSGTPNQSDS